MGEDIQSKATKDANATPRGKDICNDSNMKKKVVMGRPSLAAESTALLIVDVQPGKIVEGSRFESCRTDCHSSSDSYFVLPTIIFINQSFGRIAHPLRKIFQTSSRI